MGVSDKEVLNGRCGLKEVVAFFIVFFLFLFFYTTYCTNPRANSGVSIPPHNPLKTQKKKGPGKKDRKKKGGFYLPFCISLLPSFI